MNAVDDELVTAGNGLGTSGAADNGCSSSPQRRTSAGLADGALYEDIGHLEQISIWQGSALVTAGPWAGLGRPGRSQRLQPTVVQWLVFEAQIAWLPS